MFKKIPVDKLKLFVIQNSQIFLNFLDNYCNLRTKILGLSIDLKLSACIKTNFSRIQCNI